MSLRKVLLELVGDGMTHLGVKNLGQKSEVWDILSKSAFMMVTDQGFRPSRRGPRKEWRKDRQPERNTQKNSEMSRNARHHRNLKVIMMVNFMCQLHWIMSQTFGNTISGCVCRECFWMRLTLESVDSVKQMALLNAEHHLIHWCLNRTSMEKGRIKSLLRPHCKLGHVLSGTSG